MKVGVCVLLLLCLVCASCSALEARDDGEKMREKRRVKFNTSAARAKDLVAQMTLEEKLSMVYGKQGPYVGFTPAIPRLNIPELHLQDGPQGVGDGVNQVTAWPSALTVVATWDVDLMKQYATAMSREQRLKGTNVMLAPMVNIARVPVGGRNFESFGEDPYLASKMVVASVEGIQSQPVIATVKHFVDNNQEHDRTKVSANVPERAQWEIYYPAFKAAVDAGVGSVMCSYNKINDTYACENEQTLNIDLKQRMGFKGFVMSDWGATHSTVQAANNGLDQQMPDGTFFGQALADAVQNGQVPQSRIDDMATRILTPMFDVGIFDFPQIGTTADNANDQPQDILARQLAAEANVLLKNDGNILPINLATVKTIAVIGDDASTNPTAFGGGSGHVNTPYLVTPLTGITGRANGGLAGAPGNNRVTVNYAGTSDPNAANVAKNADIAIVFVATSSSEGTDRADLSLGTAQDQLVAAVAAAQPNTVVVVHTPGAVLMPWASSVKAIISAFLPGQEDGNSIALVLFGDVNPSGKLPLTFPVSGDQTPINTPAQYPGINEEAAYSEGLLVGYRWYDAANQQPLFEFGRGLSYATFQYGNVQTLGSVTASGLVVAFNLTNTGKVGGAEVAQLYLVYPAAANEPPKVLRGFQKVYLQAGESTEVVFDTLKAQDFSIWDVTVHDWKLVRGQFGLFVGSSSRDIRIKGSVTV